MQAQQKSFRRFDNPFWEDPATNFTDLFNLKKANAPANLPAASYNFNQPHPQQSFQNFSQNNQPNFQPHPFYYHANVAQNFTTPQNNFYHAPLKATQPKISTHPTTLWDEFKRIYITEVLAFTMSKSTLFTLIFSFMFLGCVFFLSGFFTATNIYREQHGLNTVSKHVPSETAMLQGRPEKVVNMGAGIAHNVPKAYQYQGGVKVNQNARRPSQYVESQINSHQPYYR